MKTQQSFFLSNYNELEFSFVENSGELIRYIKRIGSLFDFRSLTMN